MSLRSTATLSIPCLHPYPTTAHTRRPPTCSHACASPCDDVTRALTQLFLGLAVGVTGFLTSTLRNVGRREELCINDSLFFHYRFITNVTLIRFILLVQAVRTKIWVLNRTSTGAIFNYLSALNRSS